MPQDSPPEASQTGLSRSVVVAMAAACGISVGNIYFCQPLLDRMAFDMGVAESTAGLVNVAAQSGYCLGILLILPLADVVDPRRLVRLLLVLTALSLVAAALSPLMPVLIAASFLLTFTTVVPQILIPIASGLVAAGERGRIIGALQMGLILGILLSRTVSGGIAEASGTWRSAYFFAAILTGGLALVLPGLIPRRPLPERRTGYLGLLASLLPLLAFRPLRLSMAVGFCAFGAFSAFWSTLAFHLAGAPFGLGPAAIGLFGLYGVVGTLFAPMAGRLSDRIGTAKVNAFALMSMLMAFAVGGWFGVGSIVALIVATNLLDFGMQSGQVANQARIFGLGDDVRARLNALYMLASYGGGALGGAAGVFAWSWAGWVGVTGLGFALVALAFIILALGRGASTAAAGETH